MATLNDRAILESIINPLLPNKFLAIEEQNEREDQPLHEQGFHFRVKILAVILTFTNLFLLQMLVNM